MRKILASEDEGFAGRFDKIRLVVRAARALFKAADAPCCNFLRINYIELREEVRVQGGRNEEILELVATKTVAGYGIADRRTSTLIWDLMITTTGVANRP